jgi:hypothetical protein
VMVFCTCISCISYESLFMLFNLLFFFIIKISLGPAWPILIGWAFCLAAVACSGCLLALSCKMHVYLQFFNRNMKHSIKNKKSFVILGNYD